jgi:hypothetical protein
MAAGLLLAMASCSSTHTVTPCTDANIEDIEPSNYDQTCSVDSDCVEIAAGNACYACIVLCHNGGAINHGSLSAYESDISKTIGAGETSDLTSDCFCPAAFGPCCRGGTCHADLQCTVPIAEAGAD